MLDAAAINGMRPSTAQQPIVVPKDLNRRLAAWLCAPLADVRGRSAASIATA
jgi:hypothetical protein